MATMINPDGSNQFTGQTKYAFMRHGFWKKDMIAEAWAITREYHEMAGDECHPMAWHDELIVEFVISEDRITRR